MLHTPCSARSRFSLFAALCLGLLFVQCESGSDGGSGPPVIPDALTPDAAATVQENGKLVSIVVQRLNPTGGPVSVDYATGDGSATQPADYTKVSGTLTWAAGDTSKKTIGITVLDDQFYEGTEQFRLDFSNAQGGTLASPSTTIFIFDDETSTAPTNRTPHLIYNLPTATSIATVADIDGDKVPDVLIGDDQAGSKAGMVAVRSGAKGTQLLQITGAAGEQLGTSVCGLGDVDKDGRGDFAIAAGGTQFFIVRVYSGKAGTQLREHKGTSKGVWTKMRVASAGDVDGDGTPDVLVGLPQAPPAFGVVQIFSGKDGTPLRTFSDGKGGASFGTAIANAGDINKDGFADTLVGAPGENTSAGNDGAVYLYSGKNGAQLARLVGSAQDALFGTSVASVGDVNRDGTPDYMIGSPGAQGKVGETQVFSGANSTTLFTFRGEGVGSGHGSTVASAGDVDKDGYPDLMVSEPGDLQTRSGVGLVKIYSGDTGAQLYRFGGSTADTNFGRLLAGIGDVNRDSASDFLLGGNAALFLLSGQPMSLSSESHELSLSNGGDVVFNMNAGEQHRSRNYVIAGSFGTTPGINLGGIHVPLNADSWFNISLTLYLSAGFQQMRGLLDDKGGAKATLRFPKTVSASGVGTTLFHASIIVDSAGKVYFATNAVPLTLVK